MRAAGSWSRQGRRGIAARLAAAGILTAGTVACGPTDAGSANTETADPARAGARGQAMATGGDGMSESAGEWIVLFDGTDLSAWRGYRGPDVPAGWQVRDGLLAFVPGEGGGDIVTREEFGDFELVLDWRVSPGGNSGVFYRAPLGLGEIWHGAPEMQVLDDAAHADGGTPTTSAGALYALYPAPEGVVRPAGEWNSVRVVAEGPRVEHWLNGERIVAYEVGSEDWEARVAASKFAEWPEFGRAASGHVGLQDHGDPVWFRDIRIRRLGGSD